VDLASLPGLLSLRSMIELGEARQEVSDAERALREQQGLEDAFYQEAWQDVYSQASQVHQSVLDSVMEEAVAAEARVREEFSEEQNAAVCLVLTDSSFGEAPQEQVEEGPVLKPAELIALRIDQAKGVVYKRRANELEAAKGELDAIRVRAVEAANAAKAEVHDEKVWSRLANARLREKAARDQIDRLTAPQPRA